MMRLMPKNTHPMDMLRTGVSMLAPFDPELNDHSHEANIRKAIRLIAKVSTLITDGYRIQKGENPLPERPDLTLAGNIFYKLSGEVPQDWKIRMMDTIFILYADHEFNASTFAARVTAATLADMYAGVTSACGTLERPAPWRGERRVDEDARRHQNRRPRREMDDGCAGEEGQDHGLRPSRL